MKNTAYKIIKYIIVGGFTTVVNIIVYYVSSMVLQFDYRLATFIAWVVAVLFAYYTNKTFVFNSKSKNLKSSIHEFILFVGFRALSFLFDLAGMIFLVELIKMNDVWAKIWSNFIVLVANYLFSNFIIFKKNGR